ncbi:uncharacterized protein LOC106463178 [Limulus polyphemus]|uniref:Uncharacterized protein LOC106463178 n=1 Tax=Limulus polyphemus TaxID=6850 RepID=A0ABM1SRR9_LIMPO|nr:uncharacterized protein LOC106463178 [Limulus polyphemus]
MGLRRLLARKMGTFIFCLPALFTLATAQENSLWANGKPESMPKLVTLDVVCGKDHMSVHLEFSAPFYGHVFSKGHYGHDNCVYVKPHSGLTYVDFNIYYANCGTKPDLNGKFYENTIIIQYGTDIIEAWDEAKRLRCEWYDSYEKEAKKGLLKIAELEVVELDFQGDNVDCWMEIQEGKGPWSNQVSGIIPIGSPLTMVIAINDYEGQFDMRVKSCYAHDSIKPPVALTDEYGCVLRPKMLTPFRKVRDYNGRATVISYSHFNAFKFPDTVAVYIECSVEICRHGCPDSCQKLPYLPLPSHLKQATSLPDEEYVPLEQNIDNGYHSSGNPLDSSYPLPRDPQTKPGHPNPAIYSNNKVPLKPNVEEHDLLKKPNDKEHNLPSKPTYEEKHINQQLSYEAVELQDYKDHHLAQKPNYETYYIPQESNYQQNLPPQKTIHTQGNAEVYHQEKYSGSPNIPKDESGDYEPIAEPVPQLKPIKSGPQLSLVTQQGSPGYYNREKEVPIYHESRPNSQYVQSSHENIGYGNQNRPHAQSSAYRPQRIPLKSPVDRPPYPYPVPQFQHPRQPTNGGMMMMGQFADRADTIDSTGFSVQDFQFPHGPRSLRTRRETSDGEVLGVQQIYRALASVDLAFEPNATRDSAVVFSGRREEIVYGVCLPLPGFIAGLSLLLLLTVCSLCITGYLWYHWRLQEMKKDTKTSLTAKIFNGRLFYYYRNRKAHY